MHCSHLSAHSSIYVVLLGVLAISMTTSTFVANLAWVLLLVNWIVEGNWKEKFTDFRENRLLHFFIAFFLLHLIGLLWSDNWTFGLDDIRKKLPLLVVPLVVLTSKPLNRKENNWVLGLYITSVFVVSIIGLVRFLSIPDIPYRNIVPYISHIRFSLNICFVLCLLTYYLIQKPTSVCHSAVLGSLLAVILIFWFLGFLLLLHSYTAFVVLLLLPILFLSWKKRWFKWQGLLYLCIVVALAVVVGVFCHDYYGNCEKGEYVIENGSYVDATVDVASLRAHWNDVSGLSIDAPTPNGYAIYPTLVRYLNSCGYSKDSAGIAQLSKKDVKNIESGMANVVYDRKMSLRSMCYMIFYELECYRCNGSLGESSLLHRVELWRNAWQVFLAHPLLGVGTGDVVDVCHARLSSSNSQLSGTGKHAHNQYLSLLMAFGVVGCGLLLYLLVRVALPHPFERPFLFVVALCIVLLSCISEDTFETLAGCLFACIPCLFYHRIP